jgi:hypothetical protein
MRFAKAPVLLMAGWYDPFLPTELDDFMHIRQSAEPGVADRSNRIVFLQTRERSRYEKIGPSPWRISCRSGQSSLRRAGGIRWTLALPDRAGRESLQGSFRKAGGYSRFKVFNCAD